MFHLFSLLSDKMMVSANRKLPISTIFDKADAKALMDVIDDENYKSSGEKETQNKDGSKKRK